MTMARPIEEIQADILGLKDVPVMFIDEKLKELAEEVGQIKSDLINNIVEELRKEARHPWNRPDSRAFDTAIEIVRNKL